METKIQKLGKISFYVLFMLVLGVVVSELFFQHPLEKFRDFVMDLRSIDENVENIELDVVYPSEVLSLEPTLFMPDVRQRLVNVYEPLMQSDGDFNMNPTLALSWGLLDDLTWEINLRHGVVFHDGTSFEANDVVGSIERAKNYDDSTLMGLVELIDDVEVIDNYTLRIKTKKPDPLFLQKLSQVFIVPFESEDKELDVPVGTGPYVFEDWNGDEIVLSRNSDYWGGVSKFSKVRMKVVVDKFDRVRALLNGDADLITFVPYDAVKTLEEVGFKIESVPDLEVQFLLFNMKSIYLNNVDLRKAVSLAIDVDGLVEKLGGSYVNSVNQYVSSGVFGYSPSIEDHVYDKSLAELIVDENDFDGVTLRLHLQKDLDVLGEYVRKSLGEIGINVVVSYLEQEKFFDSLLSGDADIYFFGFKSDLGDSMDFLGSIVYSNGDFNVGNYTDERVDYLIESAFTELDALRRGSMLKEVMEIIVDEDYVGIPLIEHESVFATNKKIDVKPRLDGLVYFDELIINQ